jgi:hypothetical protein
MNSTEITMVRIYITEKSKLLNPIINYLIKDAHIRGVTVFRAIEGFGKTGVHTSTLLDLSLDLPLVIEFFDCPKKINTILEHLNTIVKPLHIVSWPAFVNE